MLEVNPLRRKKVSRREVFVKNSHSLYAPRHWDFRERFPQVHNPESTRDEGLCALWKTRLKNSEYKLLFAHGRQWPVASYIIRREKRNAGRQSKNAFAMDRSA